MPGELFSVDLWLLLRLVLLPLGATAVVAYLLSPIVIMFYERMGWVDDPKEHVHEKVIHTYPVPRGGGLVIMGALLFGVVAFLGIDKYSLGVLVGSLILTVAGVYDDIRDLNPYVRLGIGLIAGLCVVMSGIGIAYITNPLESGVLRLDTIQIPIYAWGKMRTLWVVADIFALIWILWCMNMINWSKGLDGQLPGQVVIAALVIGILSFRFEGDATQWNVALLAGITAGAYLGFLPWNMYPQKMMPGYGAGSLAGFLLAILSILSGAKLATLILVLGIPMIDALYVIAKRLAKGKSPVWGDRSHFHHLLLDMGWSKRAVAYFYWLVTLVLGFLALQLNSRQKAFTIVMLFLVFGAVLVWFNSFILSSSRSDRDSG